MNGNADIESLLSDLDCSSERMQAQEAPNGGGEEGDLYSYRRGDIPIFNFDEADRVLVSVKSLNNLQFLSSYFY